MNKVGCIRKVRKLFGYSSDTHSVFEDITEVTGRLRLNPQRFYVQQWSRDDFRYERNTDIVQRNCPKSRLALAVKTIITS